MTVDEIDEFIIVNIEHRNVWWKDVFVDHEDVYDSIIHAFMSRCEIGRLYSVYYVRQKHIIAFYFEVNHHDRRQSRYVMAVVPSISDIRNFARNDLTSIAPIVHYIQPNLDSLVSAIESYLL